MSVAAHDLRNPIAVVRASAQMAQRQIARGDTDGAQVRLRSIVEQTDRLTEMLESFLDAARVDAGNVPLRTERVDLREVVELGRRARDHAGRGPGRSAHRAGHPGWLRRQLGPRQGDPRDPCPGVQRAHVRRRLAAGQPFAEREGDRVRLVVSGGGPGPDAEEARHLFEPFYRGRSAAESGHSGSGLGLFTARGIARQHGGDVRRLDGDQFVIELPLAS